MGDNSSFQSSFSFDSKYGGISKYEQDCLVLGTLGNLADEHAVPRRPCSAERNNQLPHDCDDDVSIIKHRFQKDPYRTLKLVLLDEPGKERDKNYYMEEIEIFLKRCQTPGGKHKHNRCTEDIKITSLLFL